MGRRCTHCGGLMVSIDELKQPQSSQSVHSTFGSTTIGATSRNAYDMNVSQSVPGIPTLTLYNPSLDIRIVGVNGAVIGRRQGPYQQVFESHKYISGMHAQLIYNPDSGWGIIDKHSSNGTKLNEHELLPDVFMSIKNGDIVTLANVNLQVSIV